jgi:hypothetical protein
MELVSILILNANINQQGFNIDFGEYGLRMACS